MLRRPGLVFSALCALLLFSSTAATRNQERKSPLRFRVTLSKDVAPKAASGRLFVLMTGATREMRTIDVGFIPGSTWIAAKEVEYFAPGSTIEIDPDPQAYPKPFSQAGPG
ncbi:MAG TPA: enterochelin esterase, partial [Blastocatellia bacterium]